MKNIHECYKHIGLKHTELRQGFRIVRGRNLGVLRKYLVCKRFERKTYHYSITPPLTPLVDLQLPPTLITFNVYMLQNVYGQSDKTYKRWFTL